MTRGSRFIRNVVFNFAGQGLPLLAAVFAIPPLVRGLSTDRFGALTLMWVVVGYFSLFDLGLGRALTQVVSSRSGAGGGTQAPPVAWTALSIMFLLGGLGTIVVCFVSPLLVYTLLKIPVALRDETLQSFYLLALAIPFVVVTGGLAGILSAFNRFGALNAIRGPVGMYTFLAPLAVLPFSRSLVPMTAALVIGRLLACVAHYAVCMRLMPPMRWTLLKNYTDIRPLLHLGAWMSVSNVIGPLMIYLDRFIIGAIVSVAAVAYYATPYEMVTKLLIVPGAILGVLFPAIAATYQQDRARLVRLFTRGTKYVALILFPVTLVIVAFASEGLRWWLGDDFARNSTAVLQVLAIGVFVNSLAQVFATLVQGSGRPDVTARLHAIELPVYVVALWWAIHQYGILGAAVTWTARVLADAVLLFWLSGRLLGNAGVLLKQMATGLVLALGALVVPALLGGIVWRAATVLVLAFVFVLVAWFVVVGEDERASFRTLAGRS